MIYDLLKKNRQDTSAQVKVDSAVTEDYNVIVNTLQTTK